MAKAGKIPGLRGCWLAHAVDDPDAEQYRPRLLEVAPGHLVAEHDPV